MTARLEGGRFGPLYTGRDPSGGRDVLIRTFADSMTLAQQDVLFERLTRLCSRPMEHASIARALNSGVSGGVPYIVHEALQGTTVDEYLTAHGPRPMSEVAARVAALAAAIDFAEGCGVHHGALGPRDIAFLPDRSAVSGFGLAQALRAARVDTNEASLADDIYALGAMTFELLLGRRYDGGDLRKAFSGLGMSPSSLDALIRALESAFSPDPRLWRSSAREFADSLLDVAEPSLPAAGRAQVHEVPGRLVLGSADSVGVPSRSDGSHRSGEAAKADGSTGSGLHASPGSKAASLELMFDAPLLLFNAESGQSAAPGQSGEAGPPRIPRRESPESADFETASADSDVPPIALREAFEHAPANPVSERRAPEVNFGALDRPGASRALWAMAGIAAVALIAIAVTWLVRYRSAPPSIEPAPAAAVARIPIEEQIPVPEVSANPVSELPPAVSSGVPTPDQAPPADTRAATPSADTKPEVRDAPISPPPEPPLPLQGRLLVRSTPAGALVIVDGQPKGQTPFAVRGLEYGMHTLVVKGAGIGSWERQVELTAERPSQSFDFGTGDASDERPQLAQAATPAALQIDSRPAGAGVWVDGVRRGVTPLALGDLRSGSYAVRIELQGYRPWVASVALSGGERRHVGASLER